MYRRKFLRILDKIQESFWTLCDGLRSDRMNNNLLNPNNRYTKRQIKVYDRAGKSGSMNKENHMFHNNNPDYWDILVKETEGGFNDKIGLDFGCGCGRNVINLKDRFRRMDGVDISQYLIDQAAENTGGNSKWFVCNGIDLSCIESNQYEFLMSTITLQHIVVYDIRYNYLKEFYRVLKPGGLLSIQMVYQNGTVGYYK